MAKPDYHHWYLPTIPIAGYEPILSKDNPPITYIPITYIDMDKQLKVLQEKVRNSNSDNQRQDALVATEEQALPATGVNHPLAHLAGIFEGEYWENTLEAIRRNRQEESEDEINE